MTPGAVVDTFALVRLMSVAKQRFGIKDEVHDSSRVLVGLHAGRREKADDDAALRLEMGVEHFLPSLE